MAGEKKSVQEAQGEGRTERSGHAPDVSRNLWSGRGVGFAQFMERVSRHRAREQQLRSEQAHLKEAVLREERDAAEAVNAMRREEESALAAARAAEESSTKSQSAYERALHALDEAEQLANEATQALAEAKRRHALALRAHGDVAAKRERAEGDVQEASAARQQLEEFERSGSVASPYGTGLSGQRKNGNGNGAGKIGTGVDLRQ